MYVFAIYLWSHLFYPAIGPLESPTKQDIHVNSNLHCMPSSQRTDLKPQIKSKTHDNSSSQLFFSLSLLALNSHAQNQNSTNKIKFPSERLAVHIPTSPGLATYFRPPPKKACRYIPSSRFFLCRSPFLGAPILMLHPAFGNAGFMTHQASFYFHCMHFLL